MVPLRRFWTAWKGLLRTSIRSYRLLRQTSLKRLRGWTSLTFLNRLVIWAANSMICLWACLATWISPPWKACSLRCSGWWMRSPRWCRSPAELPKGLSHCFRPSVKGLRSLNSLMAPPRKQLVRFWVSGKRSIPFCRPLEGWPEGWPGGLAGRAGGQPSPRWARRSRTMRRSSLPVSL